MEPVEPSSPSPSPSPNRRRRVVATVTVVAVVAVAVAGAVGVRWWRSGGLRRSVKDLAEQGAVALADVIVDELLPV